MIILNIYVCTVLFALFALALMSIEVYFYSKEHGLVSTRKRSFFHTVFEWFKILLMCAIPLFNLFIGLCFAVAVFNEEFLARAIQNCIDQGTIKYKESEDEL